MKNLLTSLFLFIAILSSSQESFENQVDALSQIISTKLSEKNIKKIAVSEFADLNGDSSILGKYISDEFGIALTIHSSSYEVVERARLSVLLKEQKLSSEALINDSTRIKLGNIYGVEALVFGTITLFENDLRLTVRVINTETGSLLNAQAINITYNDRVRTLLGFKKELSKPKEEAEVSQEQSQPKQVVDLRPKCEKVGLGDLSIKNTHYNAVEVVPVNASSDMNVLTIPKFSTRVYYELPIGVQKLELRFLSNPGMFNERKVERTEIIQVNIQQCKTVSFEVQ